MREATLTSHDAARVHELTCGGHAAPLTLPGEDAETRLDALHEEHVSEERARELFVPELHADVINQRTEGAQAGRRCRGLGPLAPDADASSEGDRAGPLLLITQPRHDLEGHVGGLYEERACAVTEDCVHCAGVLGVGLQAVSDEPLQVPA